MSHSTPRAAASLVVTHARGSGSLVLLGRRQPRDRFLPDQYVFPGGRVDRSDAHTPATSELRAEVSARLVPALSKRRARALAVACMRETYEETGLAIGAVDGRDFAPALDRLDYVARAITPAGNPIRYHARFFHAAVDSTDGRLASNGELLDLGWRDFDTALELPMLDITRYLLRVVARRLGHPAGRQVDEQAALRVPFVHYRRGALQIRYE